MAASRLCPDIPGHRAGHDRCLQTIRDGLQADGRAEIQSAQGAGNHRSQAIVPQIGVESAGGDHHARLDRDLCFPQDTDQARGLAAQQFRMLPALFQGQGIGRIRFDRRPGQHFTKLIENAGLALHQPGIGAWLHLLKTMHHTCHRNGERTHQQGDAGPVCRDRPMADLLQLGDQPQAGPVVVEQGLEEREPALDDLVRG
jgi:hypothetical protein